MFYKQKSLFCCQHNNDEHPDVRVVELKHLREQYYENEIDVGLDMTSIRTLMLLDKTLNQMTLFPQEYNAEDNDQSLQRLSLAHERMHSMPKILLEEVAPTVKILDISHNEFEKLDFLEQFQELTTLICDHNDITSNQNLPFLPKLELLWMNNCKILDLYRWVYRLSSSCPNLKYLSLMGNPGLPFYTNGGSNAEQMRYRLFLLSLFPKLVHLDDKPVTEDERKKSRKLYQKDVLELIATKAQQTMPDYMRRMSQRMSQQMAVMLSCVGTSNSETETKNFIV
uniref:Leucine-rich melanocyte differentiation-associated protein-like isoform X1 n=2 Tax=Diabrotica virgifera virgifera TaxID=50390 RepID=A0A6P7G281_DIAVI